MFPPESDCWCQCHVIVIESINPIFLVTHDKYLTKTSNINTCIASYHNNHLIMIYFAPIHVQNKDISFPDEQHIVCLTKNNASKSSSWAKFLFIRAANRVISSTTESQQQGQTNLLNQSFNMQPKRHTSKHQLAEKHPTLSTDLNGSLGTKSTLAHVRLL